MYDVVFDSRTQVGTSGEAWVVLSDHVEFIESTLICGLMSALVSEITKGVQDMPKISKEEANIDPEVDEVGFCF